MPPIPKPEPIARTKRRRQRQEAAVIRDVRRRCVERDGYCRLLTDYVRELGLITGPQQLARGFGGACHGESQWCHFGDLKRAKTRKQAPERRHTTRGSLMLCAAHHQDGPLAYDRGTLRIEALSKELGCDGPLVFSAASENGEER